eukprot:355546-Chlamydomonas_euryale.AAC.2
MPPWTKCSSWLQTSGALREFIEDKYNRIVQFAKDKYAPSTKVELSINNDGNFTIPVINRDGNPIKLKDLKTMVEDGYMANALVQVGVCFSGCCIINDKYDIMSKVVQMRIVPMM